MRDYMTKLMRTEVEELTQNYFNIYLDAERATAEEMAVLTAGRSVEEAAFVTGLDQALALDDFVDVWELGALPAFPGSYKWGFQKRFAKNLHHGWLNDVATRLDVNWEKVDINAGDWHAIHATLNSFQVENLDPQTLAVLEHHQAVAKLVLGGQMLFQMRASVHSMSGNEMVKLTKSVYGTYIELLRRFGTREQIREWVPYYRREIQRLIKSGRQDRRDFDKLYHSYKQMAAQFKNGKT